VAVDRKLVRGGQAPALVAQRPQRLFVELAVTNPRRTYRGVAHRRPPAAIRIEESIARIDEIIPQRVECLEQSGFE
jgi:hypothetical protein